MLDLLGVRFWAFPLQVIGMNSIAAYCMAALFESFIGQSLNTHFGKRVFESSGRAYVPCSTEQQFSWSSGSSSSGCTAASCS